MHFAVAVAQMNMDGFALEFLNLVWADVGQNQVTDINVGPDARMVALINEMDHRIDAIEHADLYGRPRDPPDFLFRNPDCLRGDIYAIESDAGNMVEAGDRIHTGLVKGAVDEAEFHAA